MPQSQFQVGVQGELIIVREPDTLFYAIFSRHPKRPKLVLLRRRPTKNEEMIDTAWQAANDKARELGWIA
jgi:hypothetical protein